MANTQGMCQSFMGDLLNGLHAFGASVIRATTTKDTFNIALMQAGTATPTNAQTTAYASTNEVTGTGYTAGGVAVTNATAPATYGGAAGNTGANSATWSPSAAASWSGLTITTSFDTALLYNATASGKNAVAAFTFTAQTITAGTLTLTFPAAGSLAGLIQLAS